MHFNYEKFDDWPVYDSIKHYYPIGISKEDGYEMYQHYPGLQKLEALIVEHIHQKGSFSNRWQEIKETLIKQTGKEVMNMTNAQTPSFSSRLILEKVPSGNLTRYKELYCTLSVLGPYYTVLGRDRTEIILKGRDVPEFRVEGNCYYSSTTILTVSPENEYANGFNQICSIIEERFKGYRFVPYSIYSQTLPGLDVRYSDEKRDKIFHGLFNDQVDLTPHTIGNIYHKSDRWIKEGYDPGNEGGWVIYPPINHLNRMDKDETNA